MLRPTLFAPLCALLMAACASPPSDPAMLSEPERAVSVTLDDLPFVGGALGEAQAGTAAMLEALETHDAPADVFVNRVRWEIGGEDDARRELMYAWLAAGHAIHNHSATHPAFSRTAISEYLADVAEGQIAVEALVEDTGDAYVSSGAFYRPPYNDLGESDTTRAALAGLLEEQDVRLAPFTVEHMDYAFNSVYSAAIGRGDTAFAHRVGEAYLAQLDTAFAFVERLSADTFGREIPQVFLIHANRINADYLGAMLGRLEARGYAFVSLEEAVADSAYATEDAYRKKWGISWLHRWRVALGLPARMRDEPEMPTWMQEAYAAR